MLDENSRTNSKNISCPQCGGVVTPIIYGLPTQQDIEDPGFYSGGCIILPENPEWACLECEIEF
jgi:hypothetical protein